MGFRLWVNRIDNLADDELIEVDNLLQVRRVQHHRFRIEAEGFGLHSERRGDQAVSARTAGRSACVGSRTALADTVTTPTVLPVMSKNSTEYPSSLTPGTTWRSTTVPTSPARSPCSEMSRVRITSLYSSKAIPLPRVHGNKSGHVASSVDLPNGHETRHFSAWRLH